MSGPSERVTDPLTDRGYRSGNGLAPCRSPPADHQEEHQSTGAKAGRADLSRRRNRRDPRPTSSDTTAVVHVTTPRPDGEINLDAAAVAWRKLLEALAANQTLEQAVLASMRHSLGEI